MKDSRMLRWVDTWGGIPLCWGLSRWLAVSGRSSPVDTTNRKPKRILLVELFEMGACVMLAPSIAEIRRQCPDAEVFVLTSDSLKAVWEILDVVESRRIFSLKSANGLQFVLSALRTLLKIRAEKFDLIIDYNLFTRVPAILAGLSSARLRAGFFRYNLEGLYRGNIYNRPCSFNQNAHISMNFLALTKSALSGAADVPNYKGSVPPEAFHLPAYSSDLKARQSIQGKLEQAGFRPGQSLIVINPDVGATLSVRNYPKDGYVEVIRRLLAAGDKFVVLTGTRDQAETAAYIAQKVRSEKVLDLSDRTSLRELFELLKLADLVLCNDNGTAHFAAVTGTLTVALFSTDSPFIYGPLGRCLILYSFYHCSPCILAFNQKQTHCRDNRCLQAISPQTIVHHVEMALRGQIQERTINNSLPYVLNAPPQNTEPILKSA